MITLRKATNILSDVSLEDEGTINTNCGCGEEKTIC